MSLALGCSGSLARVHSSARLVREVNGAEMADTPAQAPAKRQPGNWRHRENRASPKFVSKRVSEEDHLALTKYADDHGVKVAEMLEPFVSDLIRRAHEHCAQVDVQETARAS